MIRPLHDWLLIKLDPPRAQEGLIQRVREERLVTGTVLRAGPGRTFSDGVYHAMDVAQGERVAFFRENMTTKQGQLLGAVLENLAEHLCMVRANDVLFVCLGDVHVEGLCLRWFAALLERLCSTTCGYRRLSG